MLKCSDSDILLIPTERQTMEHCPNCQSKKCVKNGSVRGKKRYKCKQCGYTFTQPLPRYKYPLRQKQMFVKRFLNGEALRAIESTQTKKYKKRPSNVAIIHWLKRLDRLIADPQKVKEQCNFAFRDQQKFQELVGFLHGRSLRKIKKEERKKVGFQHVYIIFKLMGVIFPDKKIVKRKVLAKKPSTPNMSTEDRRLEQIYKMFLTRKHSF